MGCRLCEKHYGPGECIGPCFDLCDCAHCWRGWTTFPFRSRLWWRIKRVFRTRSLA